MYAMTVEPQQPSSQPEFSQYIPDAVSPQPQKSNKSPWIIVGIIAAIACISSILCITFAITGARQIIVEKAPVESSLGTFMKYMAAKDLDNAFALVSPRAQQKFTKDDLQKLITGNNYVLFEGYQSLAVQTFKLTVSANTNPDLPQGNVATVAGTVSYEGGFTGKFDAVLEKVDGIWMVYTINVTVPPDKFQPGS